MIQVGKFRLLLAGVALIFGTAAAGGQSVEEPDEETEPAVESVDDEYGQAYNQFTDSIRGLPAVLGPQLKEKYEMTDAQTEELTKLLGEQVDKFLDSHGHALFESKEKMEAAQKYAAESGMKWDNLDESIRRELADEAVPLVEALSEHYAAFADKAEAALEGRSRALLRKDRMQAEVGMKAGIKQLRVMAGREAPDSAVVVAPAGESARPEQLTIRSSAEEIKNAWQRYVDEFGRRYSLDEVQKLRAQEMLAGYLTRLAEAKRTHDGQAATQPAHTAEQSSQADAAADSRTRQRFTQRLRESDLRSDAARQLFGTMRTELLTIPTPPQRRLAEATQRPAPATAPAAGL